MADYWMKLYVEILDDPKMMMLSDRLFRRVIELFLFAKSINSDGAIPSIEGAAWKLHTTPAELISDLSAIEAATQLDGKPGIIQNRDGAWFITNFEKRQGPSPVTERVDRFRNKQRKEQYYCNEPVTKTVTTRYTEADTDTEAEVDTEEKQKTEKPPPAATTTTGEAYTKFQNEIGILSPATSDMVGGWIDDYSEPWIVDAISEAVKNNVRKPAYIDAILKRWKIEGRGNGKPKESAKVWTEAET